MLIPWGWNQNTKRSRNLEWRQMTSSGKSCEDVLLIGYCTSCSWKVQFGGFEFWKVGMTQNIHCVEHKLHFPWVSARLKLASVPPSPRSQLSQWRKDCIDVFRLSSATNAPRIRNVVCVFVYHHVMSWRSRDSEYQRTHWLQSHKSPSNPQPIGNSTVKEHHVYVVKCL